MTDPPFPRNPYVIGVPLTGDVGFFGRRGVFTFVGDALESEHQNVIVLYGQRRVGKTSLLHQLAGQLAGDVLPVYFDLQGKEQQTLGPVLYSLARTVVRPLDLSAPEQTQFDNAGRFFREEFLPAIYEQLDGRRLLLLFDEFDVLGDELATAQAASETLFPYLQDLIMHERQLAFVFVVGRRIEELATHFQAIFKQAAYRRVGLLQPEDARALIVEPTKGVLTFEEDAIQALLDLTAGHPYFTQLLCSETFNAMKALNQRTVAEGDILELVDRAIESGHGALTWFWDGLPRAERFILSAVAHVTDEAGLASKEAIRQILEKHRIVLTGMELTDAPDRLVEWEMLRREGPDHYRFVVELVRRWIIKAHPLDSARRDVDYISQRALRLYENAREAHTAGDLAYALEEYRRALDANPNHSGAQLGLAQVLFELGQVEESIEEFGRAYALDEMSARDGLVRAHLAQGKKQEEAGQANEAVIQYEQALQVSPADETARRRLAAIWLGRGHQALASQGLVAAAEGYQKALDYESGETTAREIRLQLQEHAQQAEGKGDFEEALITNQQLQELLLGDEEALAMQVALWMRRGDALAKAGEGAEAVRAYQHALELSPDDATLSAKLAAVSAEWEKLLETDHLFNKAMVAHQSGDWFTAEGGWLQLVKMDVLNYKGHNVAALLAEASEGSQRLREAHQAIFERGQKAHRSGDWPAAEAAWRELIDAGVETYVGQEIRPLLEEAGAKRAEEQQPKHSEDEGKGIPRYAWAVFGVIIVFIVGGILFTTYQPRQNAAGATAADSTATAVAIANATAGAKLTTLAAGATATAVSGTNATVQPALPVHVSEAVSSPSVLYHADFDTLSPSFWSNTGASVETTDGLIEITGMPDWQTHFSYERSINEGEAALILFKYEAGADFLLKLDTGEWLTSSYRRWGAKHDAKPNIWGGANTVDTISFSGDLKSSPDTWYYLLLAAGNQGDLLAQVWERDDPSQKAEMRHFLGADWAGRTWWFGIQGDQGKLTIDSFTHLAFSEMR